MWPPLLQTDLQDALLLSFRGKVRDVYKVGEEMLLLVATDRISAFDVVMANGIPDKGKILTAASTFWFQWIQKNLKQVRTHFVAADWETILTNAPQLAKFEDQLKDRSMLVWKMKQKVPVEGVVRGYLYGSGWRDYQATGQTSGVELPKGMCQAEELPEPIFTPATKAETGHDENLPLEELIKQGLVSGEQADAVRNLSLQLYSAISAFAEKEKRVIIADTKFEFGVCDEEIYLIDEVITPDSSRIWPQDKWQPGKTQEDYCFDKEYVRRYLDGLVSKGEWDKDPSKPGPRLPDEVVEECQQRYQAYLDLLLAA